MKQHHQTFIIEMIKHGDKTLAYQKAYPKCTDEHSARKSAERLLRHHPEIAAEIEDAAANIRQRAYAEAYHLHTEQQKVKLLSMMERREILARIAKCEIKVCRYVKDGDRYRMLFEDPHPREIIRAVEADTRIEDMCNRARDLTDPKLSQFNIYIDGRPCDDPTAPINHELPPGIFMLPRTRKKLNPEQGIKTEHFHKEDTHHTSPPPGDLGVCLAQEKTPAEQGIILEHFHKEDTHHTSPPPGDLRVCLAQEKTPAEQGIILEQSQNTSPLPGDLGVLLALENSPLYPQYLALYEKRKLQAEDLLSASFYAQDQRAIASAPPPKILTEEEVRQLHEEADRKREEKKKPSQPQYNTFGKMYFPPERR